MTTSRKLPRIRRSRVATKRKSPGATTAQHEERRRFFADALEAEQEALRTGLAFDADEVHAAMALRARRAKAGRPKARTLHKSSTQTPE